MFCESCKTAMRIKKCYLTISGDSSPETETKLYRNLELFCPNKKCKAYGVAKLIKSEVDLAKEGEKIG